MEKFNCLVRDNDYIHSYQISIVLMFSVSSSPLNFTLSPVSHSPNKLIATWMPPAVTFGNVNNYIVYCNTSDNQTYPEQVIGKNVPTNRTVVNGTTLSVTIIGFMPFTQYDCYVTASSTVGEGTASLLARNRTDQSGK